MKKHQINIHGHKLTAVTVGSLCSAYTIIFPKGSHTSSKIDLYISTVNGQIELIMQLLCIYMFLTMLYTTTGVVVMARGSHDQKFCLF